MKQFESNLHESFSPRAKNFPGGIVRDGVIYHGVAQIRLVSLLFNSLRENVAREVARYFPTAADV